MINIYTDMIPLNIFQTILSFFVKEYFLITIGV
jgi:hypothetical protein